MVVKMTFRAQKPANRRDRFDRATTICAPQAFLTEWMRVVLGSAKTL
jgi:hypothetical protein